MNQQVGNDADLFLRKGAPPTLTEYDAASRTPGTSVEEVIVNGEDLSTGTWYMGVLSSPATTWGSSGTSTSSAEVEGMGATVYDGGTSFRVWAPNATGVAVASSFNGWSQAIAQLADEGNGHWSLDYRDLPAGERYRFVLDTPSGRLWKNDPRARQLESSVGAGIVIDPNSYAWQTQGYTSPAWNDLVIYEMHVGTFFDAAGGAPSRTSRASPRGSTTSPTSGSARSR